MNPSKCENCGELLPPVSDGFCTFCHEPIVRSSSTLPTSTQPEVSDNPSASPSSPAIGDVDSIQLGRWITNVSTVYLVVAPLFSAVMIQLLGENASILSQIVRTSLCFLFANAIWKRVNFARLFVAIFALFLASLMTYVTIRKGFRFTLAFTGAWLLVASAGLMGIGLLFPTTKRYFHSKIAA
jgi:hypothetical protein